MNDLKTAEPDQLQQLGDFFKKKAGGEDDPRSEALDESDGTVVEGLSLDEAGEEEGEGHAKHRGDEDGEGLEVRCHCGVAARDGMGGEVCLAWCYRHGSVV